ncbi:hypothetical protein B296_00012802 [Ensete ventricosum]|uniref:Uncharacterized protein n=1 Tax=Ensete ventricosum TaxID=4639 RepID=A0A427AIP0_ENSVE|nr:hypothetical protein B296_00012802 [Ensete ventricosum]
MKSGGSGTMAPSMANASPTVELVVFMAEKHPRTDEDTKLRKRSKRTASEQLAGATESTTKAPTEKGRERLGREKSRSRLRKSLSEGTPLGICVKWKTGQGRTASREFEPGLEKMVHISYEFGYRMALKRFQAKHLEAEVETDPFAKCPKDDNVTIDL